MEHNDSTNRGRFPFSVLDLSPIVQGSNASASFANSLELAQHAEKWGYNRYWLAEHHNMPGIASAATSVVIAHIAGGTQTIRVGSGGIMLPNHSPLVIAEQFGTLEALYPGRIDLGLGRAPGTDQMTARALRRDLSQSADSFPQDVQELQRYFAPASPGQRINAVPGVGLEVPIWLLGSSVYSASLAGHLGLPFAFASHFAPDLLMKALEIYRAHFQPSNVLAEPYAMVAVNVFAADTEAEAKRLFTSVQQSFVNLRRGNPGLLPPPLEGDERPWAEYEQDNIDHALAFSFVGTTDIVRDGLQNVVDKTGADELIVTGMIYDQEARLHSFELAAQALKQLQPARELVAA
jgi:luciferase family oxidoreductase group 1